MSVSILIPRLDFPNHEEKISEIERINELIHEFDNQRHLFLIIKNVRYALTRTTATFAHQDYPRISLDAAEYTVIRELTITDVSDLQYFTDRYKSKVYILEVGIYLFRMERIDNYNAL